MVIVVILTIILSLSFVCENSPWSLGPGTKDKLHQPLPAQILWISRYLWAKPHSSHLAHFVLFWGSSLTALGIIAISLLHCIPQDRDSPSSVSPRVPGSVSTCAQSRFQAQCYGQNFGLKPEDLGLMSSDFSSTSLYVSGRTSPTGPFRNARDWRMLSVGLWDPRRRASSEVNFSYIQTLFLTSCPPTSLMHRIHWFWDLAQEGHQICHTRKPQLAQKF